MDCEIPATFNEESEMPDFSGIQFAVGEILKIHNNTLRSK